MQSKDFIANVAAILMPAISEVVNDAVNKAVALAISPTMSKQDFAAANRISESVLEKWISNGVVLLAPTPSFIYTQNHTNKKTGEKVPTTMTKHGNPLINVAAWREKTVNTQSNVATSNPNLILQVEGILNMFDFKVSNHAHYDDACRKFALTHNIEDVAQQAGLRAQTLCTKLNPNQPHQLTVQEVLVLTDVTEDATLIDGLLAQIQCLPCVPVNEVANDKLPLYVMKATAEVGQLAAGAISTEQMNASCKRGLLQNVNSGIRCLTLAALPVQARIQSNPALSSTVDAISGLGASFCAV